MKPLSGRLWHSTWPQNESHLALYQRSAATCMNLAKAQDMKHERANATNNEHREHMVDKVDSFADGLLKLR